MKRKPSARDEEFLLKVKGISGRSSDKALYTKSQWLSDDFKRLVQLVKEFGKDYKRIAAEFEGKKTTVQVGIDL